MPKRQRCGLLVVLGLGCLGLARAGSVYAPAPELRTILDPATGLDVPTQRYLDLGRARAWPSSEGYAPAPAPWQREWELAAPARDAARYLDLGSCLARSAD